VAKAKRKASSGKAKDQGKEPSNEQPQKYDETFKKWITQQVDEILPIETVPLFLMNAEAYVQNHQTCMYPLLPAMCGFHADMAVQAVNELSERYRDDRARLSEQFIWMQLCLARTQTLELTEKIHIQERLSMFDQLWEENPTIQKMRAEYLQKGRQEERQRELQGLRHLLVSIVQPKYPVFLEHKMRIGAASRLWCGSNPLVYFSFLSTLAFSLLPS
jgi:hypothetical protein